jgi:uncharacterized membrane protein YgcG
MKRLAVTAAILATGLVALLAAGNVSAGVQDFYFSNFTADYYLSKDGAGASVLGVREALTAEFPQVNQNKGIVRFIPRTNQGGKNRVFSDTHVDITRNGQPEPIYETETDSQNYYVSTGTDDYLRGKQEYSFSYGFTRVVTEFDGYQELYWDTNGTGWKQRFESLTARVHLANGLEDAFTGDVKCFVGQYGSKNETDCAYDAKDGVLEFSARRTLAAGENLTFAIKFKPGTFVVPPPDTSYGVFLVATVCIVAFLLWLGIMAVIYYRKVYVRKKRNQAFTVPQYLPPKGISVAGAAYIYSKAGGSGMAAQLIDLAVKGKVRILESEGGRVFKKKQYSVELLNTDGLLSDEKQLLDVLIGSHVGVPTISLSKLSTDRQVGLAALAKDKYAYKSLAAGGFVNQKEAKFLSVVMITLGSMWLMTAIIAFIALMIVVDYAVGMEMFMPVPCIVALVVTAAGTFKANSKMLSQWQMCANLTDEGYQMRNYLRGLEEYIKLAETDRIKFLQGPETAEKINVDDKTAMVKLYEKLLPYAMIFKQEKQWAKALELYYDDTHQPNWYSGGKFGAVAFASSVGAFSSSMRSTYGSGTGGSSSSGSGFGGGGGSGGGGGGGGGGGR